MNTARSSAEESAIRLVEREDTSRKARELAAAAKLVRLLDSMPTHPMTDHQVLALGQARWLARTLLASLEATKPRAICVDCLDADADASVDGDGAMLCRGCRVQREFRRAENEVSVMCVFPEEG